MHAWVAGWHIEIVQTGHCTLAGLLRAVALRVQAVSCAVVAGDEGIACSCRSRFCIASRAWGVTGGVGGGKCRCACVVLHGSFMGSWRATQAVRAGWRRGGVRDECARIVCAHAVLIWDSMVV